jgi:histone H1/5
MQVARPCVPLSDGLGLVIGVLSYNGTISFGLSGDPAIIDDLGEFRQALEKAFYGLIKSTGADKPAESKPQPKKKAASGKKASTVKKKTAAPKKKAATPKKKAAAPKKKAAEPKKKAAARKKPATPRKKSS